MALFDTVKIHIEENKAIKTNKVQNNNFLFSLKVGISFCNTQVSCLTTSAMRIKTICTNKSSMKAPKCCVIYSLKDNTKYSSLG